MTYQNSIWPVLETKDAGEEDDIAAALADMTKAFEEKSAEFADELKAANERADDLETRIARGLGGRASDDEPSAEAKAFNGYLRNGTEALDPDQVKALSLGTDSAGGYLADDDFEAQLIKNLVEQSPVRSAARATNIASGSIKIPRRTATGTASWVAETATRSESAPTYDQVEITAHEAACYIDVSNQLLEDSEIDLASELRMDFAEEFGRLEGSAFVNGNGTGKPTGFMNGTAIGAVNSGAAAAVTADGLIDLFYSMPGMYRNRGVFMCNSTTLGTIRKLKDGDGNYLWRPGLAEGQPETILGRPVIDAVDMPDIAANAHPVAFGDFQAGYLIADRVSLSVLRDPYTVATSGLTRFHARRRVGGAIVKAEALKKLKIAA